MILPQSFFNRNTQKVAMELPGKQLVRQLPNGIVTLEITEVEVYDGTQDLASHARFGETARTAPMFGPPGHWYLYLVYGMYWMINITTREAGYPAAILIRAAGQWDGPGKLSRALDVGKDMNARKADKKSTLWFEENIRKVDPKDIIKTPRIGVHYAKEWKDKPLRFVLTK